MQASLPPAVCEKAKVMERLLVRVSAGEALEVVCCDLGLSITTKELARLQRRYRRGGECWGALVDRRFGHPRKANSAVREWLYQRKRDAPGLSAEELVGEVKEHWGVSLSLGHMNYLLRRVGLASRPGPRVRVRVQVPAVEGAAAGSVPPVAPAPPEQSLDNAGVFLGGRAAGDGDGQTHRRVPGSGHSHQR